MASKFNFKQVATRMKTVERRFIQKGIKLAQQEMEENFDTESAKEIGSWEDLVYRDVPPPILDLKGKLKDAAINGKPVIVGNVGTLTIDPIDPRRVSGNFNGGYASFHQQTDSDGNIIGDAGFNKIREFVTQSKDLESKQVSLLISELNNSFR